MAPPLEDCLTLANGLFYSSWCGRLPDIDLTCSIKWLIFQVGTVYQLIITISILLAQILGMKNVLGNEPGWPFLLGLTVIPGVLQLLTLPFCPESPKYLLLDKDDQEGATNALTWLRGSLDVQNGANILGHFRTF